MSDSTDTSIEKRNALEQLWSAGARFCVHINTAVPDVVLPQHLMRDAEVMLELDRDMPIPIHGFGTYAWGWEATLSFARQPSLVKLPWSSVWAIRLSSADRGMLWAADAPADLATQARAAIPTPRPPAPPKMSTAWRAPKGRGHLRLVK